ncbi:MAG TPA: phosphoribosylamine--glycine ligase [Ktedonobacteraceae bacterium]|nr:phosphoribosylamine--glycine ligase [Ktedonobacteraceae bacterium]
MLVMVIGSGAREHALVWKLAQSQRVSALYAAPGNPGMAEQAECVPIAVTQLQALADFAERNNIDLTVVGPEVPLVEGIADVFRRRGLRIFGPGAAGAALEGSKAFAKELMTLAGIPTAQHHTFTNARDAFAYLEEHGAPVVVKADGNAAGKGAIVALDMQAAREAVQQMMVERVFGAAGDVVVIEDYLEGDEIGSTIVCKGTHYLPLALTQDHKRALDSDQGLNTGGMGAYTPLPFVDKASESQIYRQIVAPTLQALKERGIDFSGVLYSNIMLTPRGPMVLEHNTRFGDPETQALMLLMRADLLNVLEFAETMPVKLNTLWQPGFAASLTLAAGGYPGKYRTGLPISGIAEANRIAGVRVFHAGTALHGGQLVTAGGRVLSVAAHGPTLQEALDKAYEAASYISFEGMHYRRDIGHRGLGK